MKPQMKNHVQKYLKFKIENKIQILNLLTTP